MLVSLLGSRSAFPRTAADAAATKDPRTPVSDRYPSREAYLAKAQGVCDDLVTGGYLLITDVPQVMRRMQQQFDLVISQ